MDFDLFAEPLGVGKVFKNTDVVLAHWGSVSTGTELILGNVRKRSSLHSLDSIR